MSEMEELLDNLPGSPEAKKRVQVILQRFAGKLNDQEACAILGISLMDLNALTSSVFKEMYDVALRDVLTEEIRQP